MAKVTDKQQRFVEEYLKDLNASQAALRAGYSEKSAGHLGAQLLAKPHIAELIAQGKAKRSEKTAIDAAYVLNRLVEIDQMDVADILNDDGSVKAVRDWPRAWRTYVSGMDLSELWEGSGDERQMVGLLKKIKWPDKVKNLELLGKHVDVQAWKEQRELSGGLAISHEDALEALE
ncbi:terminase small subunit [Halomonas sp. ATCH28]|uniref:Terminase small subunit n=1 Tax=Halomonas gemina TaxID=2945105 RepID=A0ABT0T4B3_9GAMM|nr:terminase small subunit [Halomonas gemina]MCL7941210.1 terminase small subunit [Halomonas gemina]